MGKLMQEVRILSLDHHATSLSTASDAGNLPGINIVVLKESNSWKHLPIINRTSVIVHKIENSQGSNQVLVEINPKGTATC